jgi:hypothetical protein
MVLGFMGIGAAVEAIEEVRIVEAIEEVRITVKHVSDASEEIMKFQKENDQFPDNATGQKMVEKHLDGHGKPPRYTLKDKKSFEIRSAGDDGKFDTQDDYVQTFPSTSSDLD